MWNNNQYYYGFFFYKWSHGYNTSMSFFYFPFHTLALLSNNKAKTPNLVSDHIFLLEGTTLSVILHVLLFVYESFQRSPMKDTSIQFQTHSSLFPVLISYGYLLNYPKI